MLLVRPARMKDAESLAALHRDNRDPLAPFEPLRGEEFFTADGQRSRLAVLLADQDLERADPYVIEVDGRPGG